MWYPTDGGPDGVPARAARSAARPAVEGLAGQATENGPVVDEIPLDQTDKMDVLVVWAAWQDVPSEIRSDVILEANKYALALPESRRSGFPKGTSCHASHTDQHVHLVGLAQRDWGDDRPVLGRLARQFPRQLVEEDGARPRRNAVGAAVSRMTGITTS